MENYKYIEFGILFPDQNEKETRNPVSQAELDSLIQEVEYKNSLKDGYEYKIGFLDGKYPFISSQKIEYTNEMLRRKREIECFPYINRGKLWYDTLTEEQINELNLWYVEWLNVTNTKIIPTKPHWLT